MEQIIAAMSDNESCPTKPSSDLISIERMPCEESDSRQEKPALARNRTWRWWLLLGSIGVFGLCFRGYYIVHAHVMQPVNDQQNVRGDGVDYYAYARNLVRHGTFSKAPEGQSPLIGDSYRDPGYSLFLAGWMEIFPRWDAWLSLIHI